MIFAAALAVGFVGFLFGAIPSGVLFARFRGVNLQEVGSGNIGATNAARALGKPIGVLVLLCDTGKAALPLYLAHQLLPDGPERPWLLAAGGFGAVLGHMFPPWLRFRGGKGVATGLGVFLILAPIAAAIAAGVWIVVYAVTRVSSLGSLIAVAALPLAIHLRHAPAAYFFLSLALLPLILWKHRDNIRRLLRRQERRV